MLGLTLSSVMYSSVLPEGQLESVSSKRARSMTLGNFWTHMSPGRPRTNHTGKVEY